MKRCHQSTVLKSGTCCQKSTGRVKSGNQMITRRWCRTDPNRFHIRQQKSDDCAVAATQMAYQTVTNYQLPRDESLHLLTKKGIYFCHRDLEGTNFLALPKFFRETLAISARLTTSNNKTLIKNLDKYKCLLYFVHNKNHVLIIDTHEWNLTVKRRYLYIRDPQRRHAEIVDPTLDPRFKPDTRGKHRYICISANMA